MLMNNKTRILIIGASGKIGNELFHILKSKKYQSIFSVFGTYHSNKINHLDFLDLTNTEKIQQYLTKIEPDIIIDAAAITYPPYCEENKQLAYAVNTKSVFQMVEYSKKTNCKLVFISSDQVYSSKSSPISETDLLEPLNYYSETKIESENAVLILEQYLIIRTSWINDTRFNSKSFLTQILSSLKENKIFNARSDYFGHPSYSKNVAEIIIELILKNEIGIFNVSGSTYIDRYNFAKKIANAFCLDPSLIREVSINDSKIQRPTKINLNLEKIKSKISTKLYTLDEQLELMRSNYDFGINIRDVKLVPLKSINDTRGSLSVLVSKDRNPIPHAEKIQEVYFTDIQNTNTIRANHKHKKIDEFFIMLNGSAKFILFDDRKDSSTFGNKFSIFLNGNFRCSLFVPAQIYHVFKTLEQKSQCLAIASNPYDVTEPDEVPAAEEMFSSDL